MRSLDPVADVAAVAEDCARREIEREGVPVVLAMPDRREAPVPVVDPRALAEGGRFAALLDAYGEELAPGAADDDVAALYAVVEVMGRAHVGPGTDGA
ncbi:hypothetical protein [Vallicoccus soli]|uniref:Uncharacterized protein n=1 Tax=Vallicoccus soli TaxID=2339232 RepID=A0A3A3YSB8_9ACTN|nr:hypothetical protein [Vallicoccus soli]RJK94241.1 hypothetical protein D5H78_14710 [Vallicoccus soli]